MTAEQMRAARHAVNERLRMRMKHWAATALASAARAKGARDIARALRMKHGAATALDSTARAEAARGIACAPGAARRAAMRGVAIP